MRGVRLQEKTSRRDKKGLCLSTLLAQVVKKSFDHKLQAHLPQKEVAVN